MKCLLLLLLIMSCFFQSYSQAKSNGDELKRLLSTHPAQGLAKVNASMEAASRKNDFKSAALFASLLGNHYLKNDDATRANFYDSVSLFYAKRSADSLLMLKAANNYINASFQSNDFPAAARLLAEAEPYLAVDTSEQLRWLRFKAYYCFKSFRINEALDYRKQGLALATRFHDSATAMTFKMEIGHTVLLKGKSDSMHLVFEAFEYFQRKSEYGSAAAAAIIIGSGFQFSYNPEKAIFYLNKGLELAQLAGDKKKMFEASLGIADKYLLQKRYAEAEKAVLLSHRLGREQNNTTHLAMANIYLGRLYTETNKYDQATRYFAVADSLSDVLKSDALKMVGNGYKFLLLAKMKNVREADSVAASAVGTMAKLVDKDLMKTAVQKLVEGHKLPDSVGVQTIAFLTTPKKEPLKSLGLTKDEVEKLQQMNVYTAHDENEDSLLLQKANAQLLKLETQYRTRSIADSLKLEKQQSALTREELQRRNMVVAGTAILLLLVSAGLWLQYRHRQQAERDKRRIQTLQDEIHHRVQNNLAVVNRLVDVAARNAVAEAPLETLKTRIKAIELLHRHLYSGGAEAGMVSLQSYFSDLCRAVLATMETTKDIHITIDAATEVESTVAEKLGLIVNELLTNAFKYAFANQGEGSIALRAFRDKQGLNIIVQDNGTGFPKEKRKDGYGMKLIKGLSRELNGTFSFDDANGAKFHLCLPL